MTAKGYLFCLFMAVVAAMSWMHTVTPAQAATSPRYEYTFMQDPLRSDEASGVLNAAGAKGWRLAGTICVMNVQNSQIDCHQPVFMRER
jgi:hypothetical protein